MIIESIEDLVEIIQYFENNCFNVEALFSIPRCKIWMIMLPVIDLTQKFSQEVKTDHITGEVQISAYHALVKDCARAEYTTEQIKVDLSKLKPYMHLLPRSIFLSPALSHALMDSIWEEFQPAELLKHLYLTEVEEYREGVAEGLFLDEEQISYLAQAEVPFITSLMRVYRVQIQPLLFKPSNFESFAETICPGITKLDFSQSAICGSTVTAGILGRNCKTKKQFLDNYNLRYADSDIDIMVETRGELADNYEKFDEIAKGHFNVLRKYHPSAKMERVETENHYRYLITGTRSKPIEIFHVQYIKKTIRKFHLACVRVYYDGELHFCPSFAYAMNRINPDIRWTSCNSDWRAVLVKYLTRGFHTQLSARDKRIMADYDHRFNIAHNWRQRRAVIRVFAEY